MHRRKPTGKRRCLDANAMNRELLQRLAIQRRREAAALLHAGLFPGAFYLAGYSIECALKACIARRTARFAFPNKRFAQECWTHDLDRLVHLAGAASDLERDAEANVALKLNWIVVQRWSESYRYDAAVTRTQARDLYFACTARHHGLLPWIRRRW